MNDLLRILLIDDNLDDRLLVIRELRREFPDLQVEQIIEAEGLAQALEAGDFDLVITDYQLRQTDGLAVLRASKARCPDCPVIMFTGTGSEEIAVEAMKNGLDDYILKSPKHFIRLPAAVRSALKRAEDSIERKRTEQELRHSYAVLRRTLDGTVHALAATAEERDPFAVGHQQRVTRLACAIAREMGTFVLGTVLDGTVQGEVQGLSEEQLDGIQMAGLIHDIGKTSVPVQVLVKPGPLNDLEHGLIKAHSQAGYDILKTIEFPWPVAEIVLQHHERLDGSGYPQGLSGDDILLEARILAVADVIDLMTSRRPHRLALSIDEALEEITQNRGVLYDPEAVDACLKLFTEKGFELE